MRKETRLMSACALALALGLALSGCQQAPGPSSGTPSFYANLGSPSARVDTEMARAMISAYRRNAGLGLLALDAGLVAEAQAAASAMAAADKPASADALKAMLAAKGLPGTEVNVSAGYRSLAEAFSGWRDSPQHDRVMKAPRATRLGLATAFAPGSKYQVYWVLILAP